MSRTLVRSAAVRTLEHCGSVDVLVNNVGQGYDTAVENADCEKFFYIFRLHLLAPPLLMQAVIPGMRARGSGTPGNCADNRRVTIDDSMDLPTGRL